MPLPFASMMYRLCSSPPHTFGVFKPAWRPTSTNFTPGSAGVFGKLAASTISGRFHFQSGVAKASTSSLPSTSRELPRNRLRGKFIISYFPDSKPFFSFALKLWKLFWHNSHAFFHCDNFINVHVRQLIHLATWPCDFQQIDLCALAQAENDSRIVGAHIAHATFGLCHVRDPVRSKFQ